MTQDEPWDVLVLGAGSGGYATALRAAQLGLRVALVEQDKVGGTCLHRGCIPTKALLHAAEVADQVRHAHDVGVRASFEDVDQAALQRYQEQVVRRLYQGLQGLVSASSVDLFAGHGRLVGPDVLRVTGPDGSTQDLTGRHVVLATGSRSRTLPGITVGGRIITSDDALENVQVPRHAIVLGGGVIGVEFASLWRSLGADVTVLEALETLVPAEDPSLSTGLARAFRRRGIDVRTGVRVSSATQDADGVRVTLADGSAVDGDLLLVAIGREPVTDESGLAEQGVRITDAGIHTDAALHTGVGSIYAVGDVVPGLQLAHRGFAHGISVAERISGMTPQPIAEETIPRVTYSDPELASVGLTEPEARDRYGDDGVRVLEYSLAGNGRSQILGSTGLVKIVRQTEGPIVGVHLIGARVSEQIGEAQLWVGWEAYPQDIAAFIHAHPTQNEALGEAALALAGQPLHSHT
ncbi:dihydrolipoamide dehydrogenase [Ruania alba]|uniref:Dihydrolipoyl dehydrogenase n=1 Tax=Ruania alba TaxID=648782 RepID=A0A1H5FDZ4_9MICO|nr:dihydrolipoamide dehydrogenase [Ruania alba]